MNNKNRFLLCDMLYDMLYDMLCGMLCICCVYVV